MIDRSSYFTTAEKKHISDLETFARSLLETVHVLPGSACPFFVSQLARARVLADLAVVSINELRGTIK